jgi:carbon storage regulator
MLVIRRHAGESIQIGEEVEVVVIDCGPGRVKLGIRAPKQIPVLRAEVKITREQNLAAARALAVGRNFELPPGWSGICGATGEGLVENTAIQGLPPGVDKQS